MSQDREAFLRNLLGPDFNVAALSPEDAPEFLRGLLRQTASPSTEALQAETRWLFACVREGFRDCEDPDAQTALIVIDSIESVFQHLYGLDRDSQKKYLPSTLDLLHSYIKAIQPIMDELHEKSAVRATALGRTQPKMADFQPEREHEGSGSGSAEAMREPTPIFVPPTGRAV